jgi:hypothetical protein
MAGPLTNQEKSRRLYGLVRECCDHRKAKACDGKCAFCRLNIHLYCDDVREATLIKTSAEIDWANWEAIQKGERQVGWIKFGFVALITLVIVICCNSCAVLAKVWMLPYDILEFVLTPIYGNTSTPATTSPPPVKQQQSSTSSFDNDTLNASLLAEKNLYDVNRDGEAACVDRAVLFRQYYRDGQTARLMWHFDAYYNPAFGVWAERLNHLFVRVYDDYGVAWDIEPLSKNKDINKRTVQYYWGNKYNPALVRDVTQYAAQIRNGTHRWVW